MKTAWVLHSGEYSDFSVHAVCLTEETARQAAEALGVECTEFPLLSGPDDIPTISTYRAIAFLDAQGRIHREPSIRHELSGERGVHVSGTGPFNGPRTGACVQVHAGTQEAAVKAASEYAAELGTEIAAGVPILDAIQAFNDRRAQP